MNRHRPFREMLARRTELSLAEEARLQNHLQRCAECTETAAAYARQSMLLRSVPPTEPPPALRAWVLTRIQQPRSARRFELPRPILLLSAVAAALLIFVVGLAYVAGQHRGQRSAAPALRTSLVRPAPTPPPTVRPGPQTASRTTHPHQAVRRSARAPSHARRGSAPMAGPHTHPAAPQSGPPGGYAPGSEPTVQVIPAPAVVSQQLTAPTPAAAASRANTAPRAASTPAANRPLPTAKARTAATPTPTAGGSQPPVRVGAGTNPGQTPATAEPRLPIVSVDKAPPEAIVFAPVPSPPPAPPTVPTPPSTPAPPPTSATPATPGPVYQTGATPGPNPVLVPVTPTTPIP